MAVVNARTKEINAKIVYYGPGRSGKTTNLKKIFSMLKPDVRGKLMALSTQSDRTIFFDYLPVDLGSVRGMKMKIQLYTVPGQVFYNSTRRLVLKNVDGVVFVADSSRKSLPDNLESLANLEENLTQHNLSLDSVPWVVQYNKRDADDALSIADLREKLNRWGVPEFEAVAESGQGIMQTLTGITKLVVKQLSAMPGTQAPEAPVASPAAAVPKLNVPEEPTPPQAAPPPPPAPEPEPEPVPVADPPSPEPEEIDAMIGDDLEVEVETDGLDFSDVDEAVDVPEEEVVEDLELVEEIGIKLHEDIRWEDGVLVVPVNISVDGSEFIREFRIDLQPRIHVVE